VQLVAPLRKLEPPDFYIDDLEVLIIYFSLI